MVRQSRPRGTTLGLLIVAGLVAGLAACGGARTGARPAAALCAGTAHPDRLVVSLIAPLPQSHFRLVLPRGITVRDPARVRAVASALCELPRMPHGPIACPADFGGGYRFAFSAGSRAFPPVTARASGCRSVSGLGPELRATPKFWRVLHAELGASQGATRVTGVPVAR